MRRKQRFQRGKLARYSLHHTQLPVVVRRKAMMQAAVSIQKLEFDEKIELFQQLEIAQGLRKGQKSLEALSTVSQQILHKYESLPSEREKTLFAERVKNQVYASLKKTIAEG